MFGGARPPADGCARQMTRTGVSARARERSRRGGRRKPAHAALVHNKLNLKTMNTFQDARLLVKFDSNRSRVVLFRAAAREIFIIKSNLGLESAPQASIRLAGKDRISSKAIREISGKDGRGLMRLSTSGARRDVLLDGFLGDKYGLILFFKL